MKVTLLDKDTNIKKTWSLLSETLRIRRERNTAGNKGRDQIID